MAITAGIIIAAGGLAGSYLSSQGAQNAAQTAANAAGGANALQYAMFQQGQRTIAPWAAAGTNALTSLQAKLIPGYNQFYQEGIPIDQANQITAQLKAMYPQYGNTSPQDWPALMGGPPTADQFQKSPYYDFLMQQGVTALDRSAAARGGLQSGAQQKAVTQFGQNLASTEYNNWLNQWYKSLDPYFSLAGLGQTSAGQIGQLGAQTGANMANTYQSGQNALAAGQLAQGNVWGNYFNQLGGLGGQLYYSTANTPQNPYMNQLLANRNILNAQTGNKYAYSFE